MLETPREFVAFKSFLMRGGGRRRIDRVIRDMVCPCFQERSDERFAGIKVAGAVREWGVEGRWRAFWKAWVDGCVAFSWSFAEISSTLAVF